MAAKVQETENKKASKARNREGERGQWWPCETTDTELRELQNEGMISAQARYFGRENFTRHARRPRDGDTAEVRMTEEEEEQAPRKAAPRPSKRPRAKASGSEAGASGEASAKKPKIVKPPPLDSRKAERERLKMLSTAGKRSRPIIPGAPSTAKVGGEDPKAKSPPKKKQKFKAKERLSYFLEEGQEQQALHYELHKNIALQRRVTLGQAENIRTLKDKNAELNKQLADAQGASSSLATTSSELENLRSSYQELETKLKEEQRKEQAEKQLAEKNSELIREKGEFLLKRNADSETIKRQQKELNGLRKYMETAEHHWDLLATNILEPLGYSERRRNKFPRDDVLSLVGDDCKDLISASRKICHNLSLKKSRTCGLRKLENGHSSGAGDGSASFISPRRGCHDFDYVLGT
ncbi:hypothetical protein QYE76_068041 [Lolium multiflorum]|uniref:Uncharacterized protein n=1 Tax=Lolium multiflorum TaxID=4521 RepID=A0AAD8WBB0_LOLMU|nr:hypothetical protein QYE76_068041 [Lolium multiflorum]